MNFSDFKFDPRIRSGIEALGYTVPTPIQEQAIPPVLAGRDVMGLAQTGTGKTAAFVLPLLQRILTQSGVSGYNKHVRALILEPTRELAEQTHNAIGALGAATGITSVAIYGGVGHRQQIAVLKRGVDIVVACPGRLLDHIGENNIALANVEVLILDEADQMLDMGFMPDIRRVLRHLPASRQNLLFSATMPDDIRRLAGDILRNPVTVQVGRSEPVSTVAHALYPVAQHLKTPLLMELLNEIDSESVLVFTRTKHRAKRVDEQLQKAGYRSTSLQGNLAQARRQAALDGFREGTFQILVATDIAARGIDVSDISHVINYDMPTTAEIYTHRIGRTGRAAKTGDAFTMVTPEDAIMVRQIERLLNAPIARYTVPNFDYTVRAPNKDVEFARAPREPQRRKPVTQEPRKFGSAEPKSQGRAAQPERQAAPAREPRQFPARPAQPARQERAAATSNEDNTRRRDSRRPAANQPRQDARPEPRQEQTQPSNPVRSGGGSNPRRRRRVQQPDAARNA